MVEGLTLKTKKECTRKQRSVNAAHEISIELRCHLLLTASNGESAKGVMLRVSLIQGKRLILLEMETLSLAS